MNVVDSSGWLEYSAGSQATDFFSEALVAVAAMQQGTIVELSNDIALSAARFSHTIKIPMAASIIYATANAYSADVWTQDEDLKDLGRVH